MIKIIVLTFLYVSYTLGVSEIRSELEENIRLFCISFPGNPYMCNTDYDSRVKYCETKPKDNYMCDENGKAKQGVKTYVNSKIISELEENIRLFCMRFHGNPYMCNTDYDSRVKYCATKPKDNYMCDENDKPRLKLGNM